LACSRCLLLSAPKARGRATTNLPFWNINGNGNVSPDNFIGTLNNEDFNVRTNNVLRATFDREGSMDVIGEVSSDSMHVRQKVKIGKTIILNGTGAPPMIGVGNANTINTSGAPIGSPNFCVPPTIPTGTSNSHLFLQSFICHSGNTILNYQSGGFVGIGTNNPAFLLDVQSSLARILNPTGKVEFILEGQNGSIAPVGLNIRNPLTLQTPIPGGSPPNHEWFLGMSGTTDFHIVDRRGRTPLYISQATGNVGIGFAPATNAKLDVSGQIKMKGGNPGTGKVMVSDAGGLASWSTLSALGVLSGSGTNNFVTKWTGSTLGDSQIFDDGTNVGVGNSSPSEKLDVSGNLNASGTITSNKIILGNPPGGTAKLHVINGTSLTGVSTDVGIYGFSGNNAGILGESQTNVGIFGISRSTSGFAVLGSNPGGWAGFFDGKGYFAENVGIGTQTPSQKLHVVGNAGKTSGGTSWVSLSDARLKDVNSDINNGLEIVARLHPVTYTWNALRNEKFGTEEGKKYGFLAQELQEVIPEFVIKGDEGYLWYNPSGMEAILTAAINEQQAVIETQQKELDAMRERMRRIEQMIENRGTGEKNEMEPSYDLNDEGAALDQNFPNPFIQQTTITYTLDKGNDVELNIYSYTGQLVQVLVKGFHVKGHYSVIWDTSKIPSGVYFYSLRADGMEIVKKAIHVK